MTKITVITATHNGFQFIKETIDSVLSQTYTEFEYIIINDASTDSTKDILEDYTKIDPRIKVYHNEINLERSASRNIGIKKAEGKYIAFIDDDDIWEKDKLEEQLLFLEQNTNYVFCGTNANFIDLHSHNIGASNTLEENENIRGKFLSYNPFILSSILIKKEGMTIFNEKLNMAEDYDFLLNNGRRGKIKNLRSHLVGYRFADNSSRKNELKIRYNCIKNCLKYRKYYPNFKKAFFLWIILFFVTYKLTKAINSIIPEKIKRVFF